MYLSCQIFHRSFTKEEDVGTEELEKKEEDQDLPEYLQLHQRMVRKIGEICRVVNQVTLLQYCITVIRKTVRQTNP